MTQPGVAPTGSGSPVVVPTGPVSPAASGSSAAGPSAPAEQTHSFVHEAMGSMFEVRIIGEKADYARHAADAAFLELDHLYAELNRYSPSSDVSQINALKAGQRIRVGLATFECLKASAEVNRETGGAFDVTIGRLYALWKPKAEVPPKPTDAELAEARALTGMHLVELHEDDISVSLKREGVQIDLGGIGKGYAVDKMTDILREWSIKTALTHGGQSSVYCLGSPPNKKGWTLSLRGPGEPGESFGKVHLTNRSLSGSAVLENWRHIMDPRTGRPALGHAGAWAMADTGTITDCLSTAFMVMSAQEVEAYCKAHPGVSGMLLNRAEGAGKLLKYGAWEE